MAKAVVFIEPFGSKEVIFEGSGLLGAKPVSYPRFYTPSHTCAYGMFVGNLVSYPYFSVYSFGITFVSFVARHSPIIVLGMHLQILIEVGIFLVEVVEVAYSSKPVGFAFAIVETKPSSYHSSFF